MRLEYFHLKGIPCKVESYGDLLLFRFEKANHLIPRIGKAILDLRLNWIKEVMATQVEIGLVVKKECGTHHLDDLSLLDEMDLNQSEQKYILPVYFTEGPDWDYLATTKKRSRDQIISSLINCDYSLSMLGFTPGFYYLDGLPVDLRIPRKDTPTSSVEPGTVAIGSQYLGVYHLPTPSGWYQIGRTPIKTIEVDESDINILSPGDQIKLQAIEEKEFNRLVKEEMNIIHYNEQLRSN